MNRLLLLLILLSPVSLRAGEGMFNVTAVEELPPLKTRILFFTASWCPNCGPEKENLEKYLASSPVPWLIGEGPGHHVQYVDVDTRPDLAELFKVEELPKSILLQDADELGRGSWKEVLDVWCGSTKKPETKRPAAVQVALPAREQYLNWCIARFGGQWVEANLGYTTTQHLVSVHHVHPTWISRYRLSQAQLNVIHGDCHEGRGAKWKTPAPVLSQPRQTYCPTGTCPWSRRN